MCVTQITSSADNQLAVESGCFEAEMSENLKGSISIFYSFCTNWTSRWTNYTLSDSVISLPKYGPSLASVQWLTLRDFLPPSHFTRRQIHSTERVARMLCFDQGMGKVILGHSNRGNNNNNNKRGFVVWNRGLFNSNTGPSHTNKKLQEIYFEAARHRWAIQKMWKRIGDNPTHYCSMWVTRTYRVCEETWWTSQN